MDPETLDSDQKPAKNEPPAREVNRSQVQVGGDVHGDIVGGDVIGGDKVGGDKISGDVVITGQVTGDVQVTYVQRAPIPTPPPPLHPPHSDLFVGREQEIAAYSAALDQAGIAVISGMAGMGKTTLAAELARRTAKTEEIFWHSFHEGEGIEGLIWRLAGFLATNGQEDLWSLLQNALLNHNRPPPPEMLFDYMIEQARGRNYLLCFDDFQFVVDNPLLNQLVERIRPLLLGGELKLIITSRVAPDFVQLVSFEALPGLDTADLGQMLAASDIFLEEAEIEQLQTYTGGNAQMLTLAIDLLQSGYEAQALLDQLVETDDLEDFLMDEIESRLSRNERLVMSAVAILQGYPGSQAAIEAVLDGRRQRRVIRDLSDRFLLTVTRGEAGRLYNQHAIVRDFFYEALNQCERQRMHLRAAEYYHDQEPDILLAIRHFLLGGSHAEAATLAEENVYLLLNQGNASALDNLLGQIERGQLMARQWIAVQLVCGQVNSFLGQTDQARENYLDALNELGPLSETPETAELHARIGLGMARMLEYQDPQEALDWTNKGLASGNKVEPQTQAELLVRRGSLQALLGDFESAGGSLKAGLALIPPESDAVRSLALKNLGVLSFYTGDLAAAKAYSEQALDISRRMQDIFEETSILSNYAVFQYVGGDWKEGIASFEKALEIARRLGSRGYIIEYELNLGKALIYSGDFERAQILLVDALRLAQETGEEMSVIKALLNLAELQVYRGGWVEAEAYLTNAEALVQAVGATADLPYLYGIRARTAIGMQETETAENFADQALTLATEMDDPYEVGIAAHVKGMAAKALGNSREAESYYQQSIEALAALDPFQSARAQMSLGALLSASRTREDEARINLETARNTFATLGALPDLLTAKKLITSLSRGEV